MTEPGTTGHPDRPHGGPPGQAGRGPSGAENTTLPADALGNIGQDLPGEDSTEIGHDDLPADQLPGVPGQLPEMPPPGPGQELPDHGPGAGQDLPDHGPGAGQDLPDVGTPDEDETDRERDLRRLLGHAILARRRERRARPNILVIFGDDIGLSNISWYNRGLMRYRTPNIDRIGNEGIGFATAYADQSCTAGRSSFITGQSTLRTGLTKVGFPGDAFGLSYEDVTLASLLHDAGYATGQFGKNHLGDRDEHLPTVHGFDVFQGNLYHLNAEEEPENEDFPADPRYPRPRGVLHCEARRDAPRGEPRQKITDTGPLTVARMPGIDDEFMDGATRWIRRQEREGNPWFCWFNTSRMHVWTRLKDDSQGKTGLGLYPDGMVEHDNHVGQLLDLLDDLGVAEDTIVIYSTDNGAEVFTWPDGGTTPFRGEKNMTWEGAYRVPLLMRWPGMFPAGVECSDTIALLDFLPTLMAAVGNDHVKDDLAAARGLKVDGHTYRNKLDGYNLLPHLTAKTAAERRRAGPWPRREFIYVTDGGEVAAIRFDQWKLVFLISTGHGLGVWTEPFMVKRMPAVINLYADPYERGEEEGMSYPEWYLRHAYLMTGPAQLFAAMAESFTVYPARTADRNLFRVGGKRSPVANTIGAIDRGKQLAGIARLLTSAPVD
jgi:arylsulfatase A-like enzyme